LVATRYDRIGAGYAARRIEDGALRELIRESLGSAQSVVNVGAGPGSYEPDDLMVLAIEPSVVMTEQRPPDRPAIRGTAQELPLHDQSVDAAMAVLSLHHWHPDQQRGVSELCRVARDRIVIVTIDAEVSARMWLMAEYLHEVRDLDREIFPPISAILDWLDRPATVRAIPVSRNTPDHTLLSFWAHPERVLDPDARSATSGFARQPRTVVERVVRTMEADLRSGAWDTRHGALRILDHYDGGLRLICAARDPNGRMH
jgi:SAM-dependent methyltransferase